MSVAIIFIFSTKSDIAKDFPPAPAHRSIIVSFSLTPQSKDTNWLPSS